MLCDSSPRIDQDIVKYMQKHIKPKSECCSNERSSPLVVLCSQYVLFSHLPAVVLVFSDFSILSVVFILPLVLPPRHENCYTDFPSMRATTCACGFSQGQ